MNPYALQDADREATINEAETLDAVSSYHLDVFRDDPPDRCASRCAFKDPWGACTIWQRWPSCELAKLLEEEGIIEP